MSAVNTGWALMDATQSINNITHANGGSLIVAAVCSIVYEGRIMYE